MWTSYIVEHSVMSADIKLSVAEQKNCVAGWVRDYMVGLNGRDAVLADLLAHLEARILWHDDRVRLMSQAVLAST
jgi:hypothetical protein